MFEVLSFAAAQSRRMGLRTSELAAVEHLYAFARRGGGLTPTRLG